QRMPGQFLAEFCAGNVPNEHPRTDACRGQPLAVGRESQCINRPVVPLKGTDDLPGFQVNQVDRRGANLVLLEPESSHRQELAVVRQSSGVQFTLGPGSDWGPQHVNRFPGPRVPNTDGLVLRNGNHSSTFGIKQYLVDLGRVAARVEYQHGTTLGRG